MNMIYKLSPYYPYKQDTFDVNESFTDEDIQYLANHSFNMIRLGMQMAGVMPQYDYINTTYLQEMEKIINRLGEAGIYTMIDAHQDLLSEYTCGEMLPDYSVPYERSDIAKFPLPVTNEPFERDPETHKISQEQCLSQNFAKWYMSDMVSFYTKCLYNSTCKPFEDGEYKDLVLQDEFKKFWGNVSEYFKDNEYVIGYDVLNEPASLSKNLLDNESLYIRPWDFEKVYLEPFYLEVIPVIYEHDKNHLIHFEPLAANWFPTGMTDILDKLEEKGVPRDMLAWAYHVYCSTNFTTADPTKRLCTLEENLQYFFKVTNGLENLNITSFADEFGAFPDDDVGHKTLIDQLSIFEMFNQPWSYWQYKPFNDPTTCFNTQENNNEGLWYNNGTEQTVKVKILSHPYLQLCNGHIISQSFEWYGKTLQVRFTTGEVDGNSIITLGHYYQNFGKNHIVRRGVEGEDFQIDQSQPDKIIIKNLIKDKEVEIIFYDDE